MTWSPDQYLKFRDERFAPFDDLIALVRIRPNMHAIDLGCGSGELTARLADALTDGKVLGIDNDRAMIDRAMHHQRQGLDFRLQSVEEVAGKWDLIFSNAALHWVDDHPSILRKLLAILKPGGQLTVQMPSGTRNKAQKAVSAIAATEPFQSALNGWRWRFPVLAIDEYARILYDCKVGGMVVFEKIFPHILADSDAVFQWVRGTTMVPYRERLPGDLIGRFELAVLSEIRRHYPEKPAFFPFRRVFIAAYL